MIFSFLIVSFCMARRWVVGDLVTIWFVGDEMV